LRLAKPLSDLALREPRPLPDGHQSVTDNLVVALIYPHGLGSRRFCGLIN
jgi:hypothetical protein